jgi:calcium/calmodulin-dependent protein kinase I
MARTESNVKGVVDITTISLVEVKNAEIKILTPDGQLMLRASSSEDASRWASEINLTLSDMQQDSMQKDSSTAGAATTAVRHDVSFMHEQYSVSDTILGKGAFAVVKLATKKENGSEWAVKCTDKTKLSQEDKEDLYKEIKVLKLLGNHPCAVHMSDFFEDDSSMFIMMDYMKGGELFDRIVQKEKYTEGEARQVVKQVAHLLVYMHKRGIVHRDMKPENFLLVDESNDAQVKLADFGLAGILDPKKQNLLFDACGTPGYVAPEVLEGKAYNEGVDCWALGVITYILLCGFPPFYNDSNAQLYAAIKECKYQFIRPYWDGVSDDAKDLIRNLMCRQKQRFSAADVLKHKWIVGDGPHLLQELPSVRIELKKFNARRKLKANIFAVRECIALNKISLLVQKKKVCAGLE